MSKVVYISECQFKKLKKYIQEAEQPAFNVNVVPQEGETPAEAQQEQEENLKQAGGPELAQNANYVFKAEAFEGVSYSKKDIERSRIKRMVKEGTKFSKKDFAKFMLK